MFPFLLLFRFCWYFCRIKWQWLFKVWHWVNFQIIWRMGSTMQGTMIILEWIGITTWSICLMRNLNISRCPTTKRTYSRPAGGPHSLCRKWNIKTTSWTFAQNRLLSADFIFHTLHKLRISYHFKSSSTVCLCWIFPSFLRKSWWLVSFKGHRSIISACFSFILFVWIILAAKVCIHKQILKDGERPKTESKKVAWPMLPAIASYADVSTSSCMQLPVFWWHIFNVNKQVKVLQSISSRYIL